MNKVFPIALCLLVSLSVTAQSAQELKDQGFQVFEHQSGDTTYLMKQYFMGFLMRGDKLDHPEEEAAALQAAHLAHMAKLGEEKKLCVAGPFGDDGAMRGIVIYSVPTLEEAQALAAADPAVQAGRLKVEVRPWWAAVGTVLY